MEDLICTNCHRPFPESGVPYRCPACGGIFDFTSLPPFNPARLEADLPGIWRYRHTFGVPENSPVVSLGEGNTPLVWDEMSGQDVAFKLEYLNPTGSFKDRGSAVLVSFLKSRGVESAVEDSSGNAGASFAAYTWATPGTYAVTLTVADAAGNTDMKTFTVEVLDITPPTAAFELPAST